MLPARLPCVEKHKKRNIKGVLLSGDNFMLNTEQHCFTDSVFQYQYVLFISSMFGKDKDND